MPVLHHTNVKKLRAVGGRRTDHFDSVPPGLILRVTPAGARTYSVRYRWKGQHQRYTLGTVDEMTLAAARASAKEILQLVGRGINPQAAKREERRRNDHGTLDVLAEAFFKARPRKRGGEWRPATEAIYRHAFDHHILPRFGRRDPDEIQAEHVRLFLESLAKKTPTMAVRVLEAFRRCYSWALSRRFVKVNPLAGLDRPATPRKANRVYTNEEIRAIYALVDPARFTKAQLRAALTAVKAVAQDDSEDDVKRLVSRPEWKDLAELVPLLFLTATRSDETRAMQTGHIDVERALWRIPPEGTKTGDQTQQPHEVPLSTGALALLASMAELREDARVVSIRSSKYVFPARITAPREDAEERPRKPALYVTPPNKAIAALKRVLGLKDRGFLHHIRRTVGDRMKVDLGVPPYVVESILGHAQPELGQIYMPSSPLPAMRDALQRWSDELDRILLGVPAKQKKPAKA